jgi:TolB-like protein
LTGTPGRFILSAKKVEESFLFFMSWQSFGGAMHRMSRIVMAFLLLAAVSGFAEEFRVAIMDFTVESDNPQFKYLGKGFAELTSVELARIPGVVLVDRAKRNAALEEQAFSLSEGADEKKALQIGKLLAVDYLVSGTIIDMMGNLVVSYQVVKTETGAIVDKRQTDGAPADYKRMVREIGAGLGQMMGSKPVAVAKAPEAPKAVKQAEVLSNFSEAVEALDKKDVKTATSKLEAAQKIDPTDQAVKQFLDKLAGGTSKFAVIP